MRVGAITAALIVLGLGLLWNSASGRTQLADIYWNLVLDAGLVSPASYVGPHFWAVAISPDSKRLALGGMTRDVLLFDVESGALLPSPFQHEEWVMEVLWSQDGRWFGSSSFAGAVVIQEDATGEVVYRSDAEEVAYTLSFHPTEPLLAWGAYDGSIRIVDLAEGKDIAAIPAHEDGVLFVAWNGDGSELLSTGEDGVVRFWDGRSHEATGFLEGHTAGITSVSLSSDGRHAVSSGDDATVRLWSLTDNRQVRVERPHGGWINFTSFLPGQSRFLSVGTDRRVFVYDLDSSVGSATLLEGHEDWLMCVRPFPDGSRFASTGKDGTVRIWDAESLTPVQVIRAWPLIDQGGLRWPAL